MTTNYKLKNTYHTKWSSSYKKAGTTYTPNGTCTGFDRSPYRLLGESIKPGDTIEQCQGIFNGRYMGVQQSDGNFIVYDLLSGPGMVRWTSNTAGQGTGPYKTTYQTDGNFKIYSKMVNNYILAILHQTIQQVSVLVLVSAI